MKMPLLLFQHLGLGDHILCNGMVREVARRTDRLVLIVKSHNVDSVAYMFSDLPNLELLPVPDDEGGRCAVEAWRREGGDVMLNGIHSPAWKPKWAKRYDEAFYEMANVPFEFRWKKFDVPRDEEAEEDIYRKFAPSEPYVFVHEDVSRGFCISGRRLPRDLPLVRPEPGATNILFHYRKLVDKAAQIHCISSSFAHWIENANIGQNRYLHKYVRRDGTWNTFRNFSIVESSWW